MTGQEAAQSGAKRGRMWAIAGAIAAVVIVVALVGFLLVRPHDSHPATSPTTPAPTPSATDAVCRPTLTTGGQNASSAWDPTLITLPQSGQFAPQVLTQLDGSVTRSWGVQVDDHVFALLTASSVPGTGWSRLTVIDTAAGRALWSLPVNGTVTIVAAPALDGVSGIVVVAFPDEAKLAAYDLTTGAVRAERDGLAVTGTSVAPTPRSATDSRPAPADGFLVTSPDAGTVYRLDATTLTTRWTHAVDPNHGAQQVGDVVLASDAAYDATTGAKLAWTPVADTSYSGGSIAAAWSRTGASTAALSGIDVRTGKACWTVATSADPDSGEALASHDSTGGFWIVATDGTLQRLDPATGAVADSRGTPTATVARLKAVGSAAVVTLTSGTLVLYPAHGNPVTITTSDSDTRSIYRSGDQLIARHAPPGAGPGSLEAFSLADGTSAWKADAQLFTGVAGMMLRFDPSGAKTVVHMLR